VKVTLKTFRRVISILFAVTVVTALPLFVGVWHLRGAAPASMESLFSVFLVVHAWAGLLFTLTIVVRYLWFDVYRKRGVAGGSSASSQDSAGIPSSG